MMLRKQFSHKEKHETRLVSIRLYEVIQSSVRDLKVWNLEGNIRETFNTVDRRNIF